MTEQVFVEILGLINNVNRLNSVLMLMEGFHRNEVLELLY